MPTIRRCCIVGCLSNSRQHPQLQFFQFPKPENPFHNLWKQACHASLSRILPFKKPVVCALHFSPKCIGGRRLTGSAVPSLRLEVPSNLKAVEQLAMVEEIERSRKCAYINAVVFEWLVRANLNPQLRGLITHGMIKERADEAKQIIGLNTFIADNRWLNRFRETHLNGFAQKMAAHQLRPLGTLLKVSEIVKDLHHHFPPTSADRIAKLETMPDHYMSYVQQKYGEYDEDDDNDRKDQSPHSNHSSQLYGSNDDNYYERQSRGSDYSSKHQRSTSQSPYSLQPQQPLSNRSSPSYQNAQKRQKIDNDNENGNDNDDDDNDKDDIQAVETIDAIEQIEDLTDGPDEVPPPQPAIGGKKSKINGTATSSRNSTSSPKSTNERFSPASIVTDIQTYAQAIEYLRPLEEFVLYKENFRAIGLLSQLEVVLAKGDIKVTLPRDADV